MKTAVDSSVLFDIVKRAPLPRQPATVHGATLAQSSVCVGVVAKLAGYFDEADNHVLELAIAAGAKVIVTHNLADFVRSELRFPELRILTPAQLLKESL